MRSAENTVSAGATAAPTGVDLLAESDTGVSNDDDYTRLDNSSPDQTLSFSVSGTIPGATVTIYAFEDIAIGSAVATGETTTVVTDGQFDLIDRFHLIVARQTVEGLSPSGDSAPLRIIVDTRSPNINGVYVSGSSWSSSFKENLTSRQVGGTLGFYMQPASRTVPLPWTNLDQFTLQFDETIVASSTSLAVTGVRNPNYAISDLTIATAPANEGGGQVGIWRLAAPVTQSDRLLLTLSADVVDRAGNSANPILLPTNEDGLLAFDLAVVPGDTDKASGAGVVNAADLVNVRNRVGLTTAGVDYRFQFDVNGDGQINASDLVLVRNRVGTTLPGPGGLRAAFTPSLFGDRRIAPAARRLVEDVLSA